jgi:hypothetical protein
VRTDQKLHKQRSYCVQYGKGSARPSRNDVCLWFVTQQRCQPACPVLPCCVLSGWLQASYDVAAASLAELRATAAARNAADEAAAAAEKQRADEDFQQQHAKLSKQVCTQQQRLDALAGQVIPVELYRQRRKGLLLSTKRLQLLCAAQALNPTAWTNPTRERSPPACNSQSRMVFLVCLVYRSSMRGTRSLQQHVQRAANPPVQPPRPGAGRWVTVKWRLGSTTLSWGRGRRSTMQQRQHTESCWLIYRWVGMTQHG